MKGKNGEQMKPSKEFIAKLSRLWYMTQIGYGQIGWLVALLGWTSIVGYVLVRYIPSYLIYLVVPSSVALASFIVGYLVIKHKIYDQLNAINTETNPYLHRLIGKVSITSWMIMQQSNMLAKQNMEIWERIYPKHGFGELAEGYGKILAEIKELLDKARK